MDAASQESVLPGLVRASGTMQETLAYLGVFAVRPVIVLIGGADEIAADILDVLRPIFEQGISPVVTRRRAVVLTGGTASGVMRLAGETLHRRGMLLIGVAPEAKVASGDAGGVQLDDNHDYVLLTEGSTWGAETDNLYELAKAITASVAPGVVLLVNGGSISRQETRRFLEGGWPIITFEGSGRSADSLAEACRAKNRSNEQWGSIAGADVEIYMVSSAPAALSKQLDWRLCEDEILRSAWARFSAYDSSANREQKAAKRFNVFVAGGSVGFVAAVLLMYQVEIGTPGAPQWLGWLRHIHFIVTGLFRVLPPFISALPVGLAVAAALSDSLAADRGWYALRSAAEAIKREIYRYRAAVQHPPSGETAPRALEAALTAIDARASGYTASATPPRGRPPLHEEDDELSKLDPRSYITHRLNGQLDYFRLKIRWLRRQEIVFVATLTGLAASATLVAESFLKMWVALVVLAASALAVYQGRARLREQRGKFSLAIAELETVRLRWARLNVEQRLKPEALWALVSESETAMERENLAWAQLGQQAADEARSAPQPTLDGLFH